MNTIPLAPDPMQVLHAALATERMGLLAVFTASIEQTPATPEQRTELLKVIADLAQEVYNLRRALVASQVCGHHIEDMVRGLSKYNLILREISTQARRGDLPPHHAGEDIVAEIKASLKDQPFEV